MKTFKLVNNIAGWIIFAIASCVYLMTIEPTASFWDCGEFISTANKLEVGHPPGAPFFMLTARFFTLFASDQAHVAMMVNSFSALCSGLCIMFLFWTITHLVRRGLIFVGSNNEKITTSNTIAIIGAGAIGSLAYTFSDTFWFSAVEGEVYAYSSLFTAVVFWAMLKWEDVADEPYANRWLVLIAYLMGLSIGVHLLNLLTIPVLGLVYYFRKYDSTLKGGIIAFFISCVLLGVILYGLIPGFVLVAGWFELLFVNKLGFSFNTGTLFYALLTIGCLIWGILETMKEEKTEAEKNATNNNSSLIKAKVAFILSIALLGIPFFGSHVILGILLLAAIAVYLFVYSKKTDLAFLNLILLCSTVVLLGYSTYATVIIRSAANTPMDQNSPDDVFALKSYLNRDQYGDTPLLYGGTYASEYLREKDKASGGWGVAKEEGETLYAKKIKRSPNEPDQYEAYGNKERYKTVPETNMFFPRMYSKQANHVDAYKKWANIKGRKVTYTNMGQRQTAVVPTFADNLTFFFRYQIDFMYFRYFMWNFVGRQNDIQGHGNVIHGNWITGLDVFDNFRLGDQSNMPDQLKNNKARNKYYALPLILGILGIIYQVRKNKRENENFILTALLFFMTGLAIVLYLNQTPYQPRERDYAYAGSFYAFCIWIGYGVMFFKELIGKYLDKRVSAILATLICVPVPAIMASENWDDHDRSGRYTARDFGANYLNSLDENAVIFTNGDNDTFPLWYNQEVEGVRTDVRVANLSYLQMDWYVEQMTREAYESKPLPISIRSDQFSNGRLDVAYVQPIVKDSLDLKEVMNIMFSDDSQYAKLRERIKMYNGDNADYFPAQKAYLNVDKAQALATGTVAAKDSNKVVDKMLIDLNGKRYLGKHEVVILNMLLNNEWKRPIYYAVTVGGESFLGLRDYFQLEGLAYKIVPVKEKRRVNTEKMYDNMMNKFKWGGIENPDVYLDENNLRMTATFRHMFMTLVDALISEGKKDSAKTVLDHCMEVIPSKTVPHTYVSVYLAKQYDRLDERAKANEILDELRTEAIQYADWFVKLDKDYKKLVKGKKGTIVPLDELEEKLGILSEIVRTYDEWGDKEKLETYYPKLEEYSRFYQSLKK